MAPSHSCDQRVHDRLRVHDDVDAVVRRAEQVVGLDHLEALVHQRRRVDRDLAAHRPGRVRRAPPRRSRRRARRACGRGTGPPEAVITSRSTAPGGSPREQLVQRRVLGVDRDQLRAGGLGQRRHQLAADDQRLLVGQREVDALGRARRPSGPGRPSRRSRSARGRRPDSATSRTRPSGPGEHLAVGPRLGGARGGVGVAERDPPDAVLARLRDQRLPGALGGQADELELAAGARRRRRAPACRSSRWSRG